MNPAGSSAVIERHPVAVQELVAAHDSGVPLLHDRLLRASEVQRELGVSRATAYRMMNDGTLPIYRFGGRGGRRAMIRVSQRELSTWIAAHRSVSSVPPEAPTC